MNAYQQYSYAALIGVAVGLGILVVTYFNNQPFGAWHVLAASIPTALVTAAMIRKSRATAPCELERSRAILRAV